MSTPVLLFQTVPNISACLPLAEAGKWISFLQKVSAALDVIPLRQYPLFRSLFATGCLCIFLTTILAQKSPAGYCNAK